MTIRWIPIALSVLALACGSPAQPGSTGGGAGGGSAGGGSGGGSAGGAGGGTAGGAGGGTAGGAGGGGGGGGGSGAIDAGTDAGTMIDAGVFDAGAACDSSTTACTITWAEGDKYPTVVDHHTTAIFEADGGAYVYVFGGVRAVFSDVKEVYPAIRRAHIKDTDGSLEPWAQIGTLPIPIGFAAQAVSGNRVYLIGGISMDAMGPLASGKVLMGEVAHDGTLTWKQGSGLTKADVHGTAVVLGNKLYLIGGSAQSPKADVLVSTLGTDGVPGPWAASISLPSERSHHALVVHDGKIFLLGGFDVANQPLTQILRSEFDAQGNLTGWTVAGDMPDAPWTAGASTYGDSLFVVGGGQGGPGAESYVDRVRQARFLAGNTVSGFADLTALPVARSHVHQTPIYNGRLYSVGGRLQPSLDTMDRAFVATFK